MSPGVQAVVALIFVTVLGAVLIQPILDAADSGERLPGATGEAEPGPTRSRATDTNTPGPTPEPSPTAGASDDLSGPPRTEPLFDRYPKGCLQPDPATGQSFGIAAATGDERVEFGSPRGPDAPPGSIRARRFLGFNATGAVYAARGHDGRVFIASAGVNRSGAEQTRFKTVVWSPISPCGVGIGADGSLSSVLGGRQLVREDVRSAAYSPSGGRLALVLDEGGTTSMWITDRSGTRMREVHRIHMGTRVRLQGWSPDERTLYFTQDPLTALGFVTLARRPESGLVGPAGVLQLEQCPGRVLGIFDGSIAEIAPGAARSITGEGYTAVSCAPSGDFMAAIRDGSLVLLDRDGKTLRGLTTDTGYRDDFVDWGIRGAGVLFGRMPDDGGPAEVWHIAEGGSARNTGLVYAGPGAEAVDWSASPPTGLP